MPSCILRWASGRHTPQTNGPLFCSAPQCSGGSAIALVPHPALDRAAKLFWLPASRPVLAAFLFRHLEKLPGGDMFARTEFEIPGQGGAFGIAVEGGHCRQLRRGFRLRQGGGGFFLGPRRRLAPRHGRGLERAGSPPQDQKQCAGPKPASSSTPAALLQSRSEAVALCRHR